MGYITANGSMSISFTVPTNQTSDVYGVSFTAVNEIPAGSTAADTENFRVYLDGTTDITAKTFDQGNGYTPPGYNASSPWMADNVFWTTSQFYYTMSFDLAPGSTHTITIKGMSAAGSNQTVFLGDVQVTSVDAIFAGGIPGGGQATGQPIGSNIQETLDVEADWAKAYGLQEFTYESGWSLGGDDGGSWVQTMAKFTDPRAAAAQQTFMQYFAQAGSPVDVLGVYEQWPTWSDYYAQEGLANVSQYPLVQAVDTQANQLPPAPTNGVFAPALLKPNSAVIAYNASSGQISSAGGFYDWNVIVPQTGTYSVTLTTSGTGGTLVLLSDDATTIASGASGGSLAGSVFLTKGLHSIKVRSTSATAFSVGQIAVAQPGAPNAPAISSALDGNATVTLGWTAVAGASGYKVAYGTSSGAYTQFIDVGAALTYTLTGLTDNQTYYFAVYAYGSGGLLSLPSAEKIVTPFANGQITNLAGWDLAGDPGSEASAPVTASSARVNSSAIVRGPYLTAQNWPWNGVGAFGSYAVTHSATLASAISQGEYYQFSTGPAAGFQLSLSSVAFLPYVENHYGSDMLNFMSLAWSTDGVNFTAGPTLTLAGNYVTANLSGVAALQNTSANVIFRIYTYGEAPWESNGLYSNGGNDAVVSGSVMPTATAAAAPTLTSEVAGNASVALSWSAVSGATGYKVAYGTSSGTYGQPIDVGAALSDTVAGLTNGQPYYFVVYAYNGSGLLSAPSAQQSATPVAPAPAAPTLTSEVAGNASVALSWSAVSGATGYKVAYGTSSGAYGQPIDIGAALTNTVAGLTNGQPYYFVVYAYNASGLLSVPSTQQSATPVAPAPNAPTLTSAAAGNASVALSWSAVSGATGYKVADGTSSGAFGQPIDVGASLGYTMSGLTNGQSYYFVVYAYNGSGLLSAPSAQQTSTPVAPAPAAPTLTSAADKDSAVSLSWSAVSGATGYKVAYGTSSGIYTQTINAGALLNDTVSGLIDNQTYYFAVYAYNSSGATSLPSGEKAVTPFANGQTTNLVNWDLAGQPGSEANLPATSESVRTSSTAIVRGPNLSPDAWPWNGNGAFGSIAATHAQTLASAQNLGEYYQFSVGPASGYRLSLATLSFRAFIQNHYGADMLNYMSLAVSTDGVNFTSGPALTMVNNFVTANLSGAAALRRGRPAMSSSESTRLAKRPTRRTASTATSATTSSSAGQLLSLPR